MTTRAQQTLRRPTVSAADRAHLQHCFQRLCRVPSPSTEERDCARLVRAELEALGVVVSEDDTTSQTGSNVGNLLARIPASVGSGSEHPALLLCAHLDTVPLQAPLEPVLLEGFWENSGEGILGADNKAAVAVILTLARKLLSDGSPVDLELLFTVCEERSLAGARAFDTDALLSDFGYVFDHASPIGELVTASPGHFRLQAYFRGAAAHAGIRPQDGRSAILAAANAIANMPQGRLDEQSTVNVARIDGGTAINVVPEHCRLEAEVRSLSDQRAEAITEELVGVMQEAANIPECQCDLEISVERTFAGYSTRAGEPALELAHAALRRCGYEPVEIASGGASDANALITAGFPVLNIANETQHNHEPCERVSAEALQSMLDVALALIDCAASEPSSR
ncbi:MAG: M20/M25/M40 family metallo-hydrolase [Solirubrobacteraceae bacterium]